MFAFSFIAGGLPPAPPCDGGAECTPTVRRMVAACSPHVRRMFTAWSPQGRHIDNRVQCIISVLYVTLLVQREREKERKRET